MKKINIVLLATIIISVAFSFSNTAVAQDTPGQQGGLKKIFVQPSQPTYKGLNAGDLLNLNINTGLEPCVQISDVEPLAIDTTRIKRLLNKYVFFITQPIDHKNLSVGTFKQMVVVAFAGVDRPNVIITEGYTGKYGLNPAYDEEVARLLNCNYVLVEHRYFNKSVPFMQDDPNITWASLNWDYMTAEQEAADLHNVRVLLGKLFTGKWVATGISKGGENCMAYTSFYPEDVACSVPYVGPVAFAQEDSRPQPFIADSCGSVADRKIILGFQREVLKRRAAFEPMLKKWVEEHNMQTNLTISELLDYCVMEFSFAFWQWGYNPRIIPALDTPDDKLFSFFVRACGPDYFQSWDDSSPFFVQAAKELGYYPYSTKGLEDLLTVKSTKGYLRKIFLPGGREFKFDKKLSKRITKFVSTTSNNMIFIYGEWDPWSSVRPNNTGHSNIKIYIDPRGSHRSRISTLPEPMKNEAIALLKQWLDVKD